MNQNATALVMKFSEHEVPQWLHDGDISSFGDVFEESSGQVMDVTYIRWNAGHEGPFPDPLPYDEVFVVISGAYTVRTGDAEHTAQAGEVLYLRSGATGVYYAPEDAVVVAITHPPYREALRRSGLGDELDALER